MHITYKREIKGYSFNPHNFYLIKDYFFNETRFNSYNNFFFFKYFNILFFFYNIFPYTMTLFRCRVESLSGKYDEELKCVSARSKFKFFDRTMNTFELLNILNSIGELILETYFKEGWQKTRRGFCRLGFLRVLMGYLTF